MKFKYHRWFQWLVVPFVALAFHIYFGYRIIGRENIPEGGCVVCPNHIQLSDPPFAAVALSHRTPLRLMAKKELFQGNKLFAWLIAALGAFPVDREGADITADQDRAFEREGRPEAHHLPAGHARRGRGRDQEGSRHARGQEPRAYPAHVHHRGQGLPVPGRPSSSARRSRPTRKRRSTVRSQMTFSAASTR